MRELLIFVASCTINFSFMISLRSTSTLLKLNNSIAKGMTMTSLNLLVSLFPDLIEI